MGPKPWPPSGTCSTRISRRLTNEPEIFRCASDQPLARNFHHAQSQEQNYENDDGTLNQFATGRTFPATCPPTATTHASGGTTWGISPEPGEIPHVFPPEPKSEHHTSTL